jgi:hypothetical protein
MATNKVNLCTREGLNDAIQFVYEQQRDGRIDPKTADALNTTIRTSLKLNAELPLKLFDIAVKAQMKKISLPKGILPAWAMPDDLTASE